MSLYPPLATLRHTSSAGMPSTKIIILRRLIASSTSPPAAWRDFEAVLGCVSSLLKECAVLEDADEDAEEDAEPDPTMTTWFRRKGQSGIGVLAELELPHASAGRR